MGNAIGKYGTYLWNDEWTFVEASLTTTYKQIKKMDVCWKRVGLPHDWMIYHSENLYQDGAGWYRKIFEVNEIDDRRIFIQFDGIYMDSSIYMNGIKVSEWKYGYSAFEVDITPWTQIGKNEIVVRVSFQAPNSRWYSGAGIYRSVRQKVVHAAGMLPEGGQYFSTLEETNGWKLMLDTEAVSITTTGEKKPLSNSFKVRYLVRDVETDIIILDKETLCNGSEIVSATEDHMQVKVWDIEHPYLYEVTTILYKNKEIMQTETCKIGFRSIDFLPNKGFYLNHRKVKWNGVCEHHDLGCLGAAYNQTAMKRKFQILQKMGVNAVRTSHNMPARELMELADEMGILIMSEAFDMWEKSKTAYDYARFFNEWHSRDINSWVRRDRNHPSLIMWSIGNEIYDTHVDEKGKEITQMLLDEVMILDPRKNARVTLGSNYMPWKNAQKCADIVKLIGYNYSEAYYDMHHMEHPDWIIYGSETASIVQSRGIYHFPYKQQVLADIDEQCSSLGNSVTSWGAKSIEDCIKTERDHAFSCGQFLWTGFDYIGEPTPYQTRNSYFGQIDTAGFLKDAYYILQAEWTDCHKSPMVHIFPYWDFNEGQAIDVRVCTNANKIELFLNEVSYGIQEIDHEHGEKLTADYRLLYKKGVLKAIAYDAADNIVAVEKKYSFDEPKKIQIISDKQTIKNDGIDLAFLTVQVLDRYGHVVENAVNRMQIIVEGAGYLAGVDNGDSTDLDGYKQCEKSLFSGKLLVVIAANQVGEIKVKIVSKDLPKEEMLLQVVEANRPEGMGEQIYQCFEGNLEYSRMLEIPVRKISLSSSNGMKMNQECKETIITAQILPETATDQKLIFEAVNDSGIPVHNVEIEQSGHRAHVRAIGDGNFHLRCMSKSSTKNVRLISQLDFSVDGIGEAFTSAYEFICGGLYTDSKGQVGNGNEHGFATARDGETQVGFEKIDFGSFGSNEITIPIFALTDDPYYIQIWEGRPDCEGSQIVAEVVYQKPSIWNVYQEETYQLNKRLSGITSIYFVMKNQKVHVKGFCFSKQEKAYSILRAGECDQVYGDNFSLVDDRIENIGNNVTIDFNEMDFGKKGTDCIAIWGKTVLEKNVIQIRFTSTNVEETVDRVEIAEFYGNNNEMQMFSFPKITGKWNVSFVFLPGSQFDFHCFEFHEKNKQKG